MTQTKYEATDDDLPEIFFRPVEVTKKETGDAELLAQLAFPVIREHDLSQRHQRALEQDRRERRNGISNRPSYIKIGKKQQMYWWIDTMVSSGSISAMTAFEQKFCLDRLAQFKKYTVQGAKWITRKQYDFARYLAGKYLMNVKGDKDEIQR